MNWTKVKVILIILFLIINVILAGILINRSYNNSEGLVSNVLEILRSRDITVDAGFIHKEGRTMKISDACPITSESSGFRKKLRENGELTQDGTYIWGAFEISWYDDFIHIENSDSTLTDVDEFFASTGLDFSSAMYKGKTEEGGKTVFHYREAYEEYEIFGTMADVTISEKQVKSADIAWYELSGGHEQTLETISYADALFNFASDKARGTKPCTVSEVALGYSVDAGDMVASASQMIPCIRITTDIGSSFYYDARRPEQ